MNTQKKAERNCNYRRRYMLKTEMERSMKGKNLRAQTSLAWDYIETRVDGVHAYVYLHVCFSSLCGAGARARAEVEAMHA